MRSRTLIFFALFVFCTTGGVLTYSLTQGQEPEFLPTTKVGGPSLRPQQPNLLPPAITKQDAPTIIQPANYVAPAPVVTAPITRFGDLEKQPALTRQMIISAQRGIEWLHRYNLQNGRFISGFLPAVNAPMDGDHFMRQATAALALARAAKFTGDERYAVRASLAILNLLTETKEETKGVRFTAQPSVVCNRIAANGLLILAIHEMPNPSNDLLDRAEEMCAFIRSQQQADGSLHYTDTSDPSTTTDPIGIRTYPGIALTGVILSNKLRPASWKIEMLKKAMPYYRNAFKQSPHPTFVPWQTTAFAEAFVQSKDPAFTGYVFEMNDWLCTLQYSALDPRHQSWFGGFQTIENKLVVASPPDLMTALYAQSLADGCRVARQIPDLERYTRYRTSLIRSLQFLTTLQYAEDSCQHFAPNFRPAVLGGFHPTHQDGNLRVEDTANAVSAMLHFFNSGSAE